MFCEWNAGQLTNFLFICLDLVPKEILAKWLQYLRRTVPAIAFKASTQKQKQKLGRRKVKKNWSQQETQVSACVGAEVLMSLLNNYCRNKDIKTSIHVGIVGTSPSSIFVNVC